MPLPFDSAAKFQDYAHPEMLVSTEWLAGHLDDPGLVVAESDEDVLLYETGAGLQPGDDIVVYCRIGERSSHTWFVLQHLLGFPHVRNYDGSWTEWGNSVRVPITRGDKP